MAQRTVKCTKDLLGMMGVVQVRVPVGFPGYTEVMNLSNSDLCWICES